ncbi:hypothetical protein HDV06_002824 [Boothiomyces sp. JEL0866]|nr:hypothetical protein HDV06_002824 [Boothiomyces sp. JEL0866]
MAQEIVGKFSGSVTDWEVYGARGVPGSDYAFYTNRYVYHSTKDDFDHASVYATQYMADNLYAGILSIADDHSFLLNLGTEQTSFSGTPNFFFYDVAGIIAIMYSKTVFYVCSSFVAAFLIASVSAAGLIQKKKHDWSYYKPYLFGFGYTVLFWAISFAGVGLLSAARNSINRGSTYGMSLLSYFSSVFYIFGVAFGMNFLVAKYFFKKYNPLPGSIESGLNGSQAGLDNGRIDLHDSDSRLNEVELIRSVENFSDSLFGSNLIFWTLITILTITITAEELMVSYFLFDWTYYYVAGYILSLVKVFEKIRWIIILVVSSSIPLLVSVDLSHMFIMFFPSSFVEGLPSYIVDLFFVLPMMLYMTNLLPIFAKLQTGYPSLACFSVFLVLWICGCSVFPYSVEQPVHITPVQIWDVTTTKSANAGYMRYGLSILGFPAIMDPETWASKAMDSLPPNYNTTFVAHAAKELFFGPQVVFGLNQYPLGLDKNSDISNLINASVQNLTLDGKNGWQLNVTGSPNARYCSVISTDSVSLFKINDDQNWTSYFGNSIIYYSSMDIYRRELQNNQISIPVHVLNQGQNTLSFDVVCTYTIAEQSTEGQNWLAKLPSWTTPRGRADGSLEVWKSFSISV